MTAPPASNAQQTHQCRRLELGRHLPELLRPLQQQVTGRRSPAIHHPPRLARLRPPPRPMPRPPPPTAPACGWSGGLRSWRATPASAPMHVMARCWAARWVGSIRDARNALACHPVNLQQSRTPCIAARRLPDRTVTQAASSHFPKSQYKPHPPHPLLGGGRAAGGLCAGAGRGDRGPYCSCRAARRQVRSCGLFWGRTSCWHCTCIICDRGPCKWCLLNGPQRLLPPAIPPTKSPCHQRVVEVLDPGAHTDACPRDCRAASHRFAYVRLRCVRCGPGGPSAPVAREAAAGERLDLLLDLSAPLQVLRAERLRGMPTPQLQVRGGCLGSLILAMKRPQAGHPCPSSSAAQKPAPPPSPPYRTPGCCWSPWHAAVGGAKPLQPASGRPGRDLGVAPSRGAAVPTDERTSKNQIPFGMVCVHSPLYSSIFTRCLTPRNLLLDYPENSQELAYIARHTAGGHGMDTRIWVMFGAQKGGATAGTAYPLPLTHSKMYLQKELSLGVCQRPCDGWTLVWGISPPVEEALKSIRHREVRSKPHMAMRI